MKPARAVFGPEACARIERAIAEAEGRTSAEIVVVVADRSGRYDRAEDLFGALLGGVAVVVAWMIWQDVRPDTADWAVQTRPVLGVGVLIAVFALWAVIGAALATRVPGLAHPFIPRGQIEAEVRRRGLEAFHLFRVGHTQARTGVLIFVSLLERTAWVTGDDAANSRVDPSTWESASRAILSGFKLGKPEQGVADAVSVCSKALAAAFPRAGPDPVNQLPNGVRFMS